MAVCSSASMRWVRMIARPSSSTYSAGVVALLLARRTAGQLRLAEQPDAGVAAGEAGAHVGALSRFGAPRA